MNKLQMAHDYALKLMGRNSISIDEVVRLSFDLADAMQAEADKREKEESNKQKTKCDENVEINMYPEWDASINYPPDALVMYKGEKRLAFSIKDEWQPDWSQAPDNADSWTMRPDGKCLWWKGNPVFDGDRYSDDVLGVCHTVGYAPDFNYTGDWRNSLRKRPQ